jgi:hypothetical protein
MGYYNNKGHFFSEEESLEHRAKYGTADSVTNEKGTDGKKNNSSEYNHDYYVKNKEKWKKDSESVKKVSEFTGMKEESINNLVKVAESKGKDSKEYKDLLESLSEGDAAIASKIEKELQEKEFDVEAAARDVIRGKYKNGAERKAALGDDYELVQKKVNELMKKSGGSGKKDESSSKTEDTSEKKDSKETRDFAKISADYYQEKGKKRTEEEKKNKQVKHFDENGAIISYYDGRY